VGRLATDIGGTFTDLVHFDEATGELRFAKSLTTPDDLTRGITDTIRLGQIDPRDIGFFVHGGTTVINTGDDLMAMIARIARLVSRAS